MIELTASEALNVGARIIGLAFIHDGVQLLLARADFAPGGALDVRLTRLRRGIPFDDGLRRLAGSVIRREKVWEAISYLGIPLGIVLLAWPTAWPVLLALCIVEILVRPRIRPGLDGGDQMRRVVVWALLLRSLSAAVEVQMAAAAFVTLQLSLAYVVPGLSKVQSDMWWTGEALAGITSTQYYGQRTLAGVLARRPRLSAILGRVLVGWESLFVVSIFLGPNVTAVMLVLAVAFHVSCAFVIGLDGFVLVFAALFPSALAMSTSLAAHVESLLRFGTAAAMAAAVTAWLFTRRPASAGRGTPRNQVDVVKPPESAGRASLVLPVV